MSDEQLKNDIIEALWQVADRHDFVHSATLTGSFVNSNSLAGLSDIDFVVVVDELNSERFDVLQAEFQQAVEPVLGLAGYSFRLNPTLGPLKFNAPHLAVLHLMLYSQEAHVEHVINSPFTCLDWQESECFRKRSLSDIYPTFGLQPRHFISARRSISDYLRDYRSREVSFRELQCDATCYREVKRVKAMDNRDRHEFAYHVMRFLMLNLLKLVRRFDGQATDLDALLDSFFKVFPDGESDARSLLNELAVRKRKIDYATSIAGLDNRLEAFIAVFEKQFHDTFITNAARHIAFRHAPTALNGPPLRFQGRSNPPILPPTDDEQLGWSRLRETLQATAPIRAFVSPLERCQQSLQWAAGEPLCSLVEKPQADDRLVEINYGDCEALPVAECKQLHPSLFEAWGRSEDPRFPNGENSDDVTSRVLEFAAEKWPHNQGNSVTCTHNVVLRNLVGEMLGVPPAQRFRMHIPHMTPITFVATEKFGLFVELEPDVEREIFQSFVNNADSQSQAKQTERLLVCKS